MSRRSAKVFIFGPFISKIDVRKVFVLRLNEQGFAPGEGLFLLATQSPPRRGVPSAETFWPDWTY
jgi:hypothetical protein